MSNSKALPASVMFTGLVEGLGTIVAVEVTGPARTFTLQPDPRLPDLHEAAIGDSVSLNGCCLTIVEITNSGWRFQAGAETLSKTNLGQLRPGSRVNVERSLRANARLGGHFVQGHIDGVGTVSGVETDGEWTTLAFNISEELALPMVSKGSVAVDGVSLTVVEAGKTHFTAALIPHTLQATTLGERQVGDEVNIETDILGKYICKLLSAGTALLTH